MTPGLVNAHSRRILSIGGARRRRLDRVGHGRAGGRRAAAAGAQDQRRADLRLGRGVGERLGGGGRAARQQRRRPEERVPRAVDDADVGRRASRGSPRARRSSCRRGGARSSRSPCTGTRTTRRRSPSPRRGDDGADARPARASLDHRLDVAAARRRRGAGAVVARPARLAGPREVARRRPVRRRDRGTQRRRARVRSRDRRSDPARAGERLLRR